MNRYQKLYKRLRDGEKILIDGATGTEVEVRGVAKIENAWNGGGILTHPDIVREIHQDYLDTDAEIIIANTFATGLNVAIEAGIEEQFEFLNRRAVELAVEARASRGKDDALVAGGISHWSWKQEHPNGAILQQGATRQAAIMADAGADLIMLEMMTYIDRMKILIEASRTSGLPVWLGMSCHLDDGGVPQLRFGESLAQAIEAIADLDIPLINIMHTETRYIDSCLDVLQKVYNGPIGVYAHTGIWKGDDWVYQNTIAPEDYCDAAGRWLDRGVQIIGGCCGIGPGHMRCLSETFFNES